MLTALFPEDEKPWGEWKYYKNKCPKTQQGEPGTDRTLQQKKETREVRGGRKLTEASWTTCPVIKEQNKLKSEVAVGPQ